ncbi:MAG: SLC13 family permease, partial [Halopseudomonas sp.]
MTPEILFVFGLLALTIILFIIDRIRMDIVAMMVVVALAVSGVITPAETVSGFGQSIVVMIAGLFVVGEGLFRTGIAASAGRLLLRLGGTNEVRLLLLMIPMVAGLSAFMSSTGAVALFIPVVLSMCRKAGLSPSRLLMPLAFASLIGGMLTLIGTPPNVVVSGQMETAGLAAFGFFDFTPIGLVILVVGTLYLVFVARHLLPEGEVRESEHPHLKEFAEHYGITDHLHKVKVPVTSDLIGKNVIEAGLRTHYETTLFAIRRNGKLVSSLLPVLAKTEIMAGDTLMTYGNPEDIGRLCGEKSLILEGFPVGEMTRLHQEFGVAEVLLRPRSRMIGSTIKEGRFREKLNLSVIGIRRDNEPLIAEFNGTPLIQGDTLLVAGGWRYIEQLEKKRDFVILETPAEMSDAPSRSERAPVALAIMLSMLVLMVSGTLPSLSA